MPEISRFFGIVIRMYFDDHRPPHFHVRYAEHTATVALDRLALIEGQLPARVRALVVEWAQLHLDELRDNWTRLRTDGSFSPIAPLE